MRHDFPGNVSELARLVERAAAQAVGEELNPEDFLLPTPEWRAPVPHGESFQVPPPPGDAAPQPEREAFLERLTEEVFDKVRAITPEPVAIEALWEGDSDWSL